MPDFQNQNQQRNRGPSTVFAEQFVEEPIQVGLPWRLMIFTLVLFLFGIFIFLGLRFGYGVYLDAQIKEIDEKVEELSHEVSEEEQGYLLTFYSQLSNLQKVLSSRAFAQNVFTFLENKTLPLVFYQDVNYQADNFSITLNGVAASMRTSVQQLFVFESMPEVERISIERFSLQEGQAFFSVQLFFDESFFSRPI